MHVGSVFTTRAKLNLEKLAQSTGARPSAVYDIFTFDLKYDRRGGIHSQPRF